MVVIGHSMGGCIGRLLITDTGDKIWMGTFGKPPEQVRMPPETKKLLTDAVIFRHRPEVGRVIFIRPPSGQGPRKQLGRSPRIAQVARDTAQSRRRNA
jgi:hypothetical protein